MTDIIKRDCKYRMKLEEDILYKHAAKNSNEFLIKREKDESNDEERLPFQRDRDRIIHCRAFRRLMNKTQVFIANKGDHYRTRLTHSLEVSQISRSLALFLGLNEYLTEAIALGHDLGHTPFGHAVERLLGEILREKGAGDFKHNFQSVHVVDNLEYIYKDKVGMNLTLAVREGILKHTKTGEINYPILNLNNINVDKPSFTLEGQVVAIADEIAQVTHDLEDSIRAGILLLSDIYDTALVKWIEDKFIEKQGNKLNLQNLKKTVDIRNVLIKNMVGFLIEDVVEQSIENLSITDLSCNEMKFDEVKITFSTSVKESVKKFKEIIRNMVINSEEVSVTDEKARYIIKKLFNSYYENPQQLPDYILEKYFFKKGKELKRSIIDKSRLQNDSEFVRIICDHIASMTDQFASRQYDRLYTTEYK